MSVEMETLVVELISKCYYGRIPEGTSQRVTSSVPAPAMSHAPTPLT